MRRRRSRLEERMAYRPAAFSEAEQMKRLDDAEDVMKSGRADFSLILCCG